MSKNGKRILIYNKKIKRNMRILKKYNEFVNRINENEEPMLSPEEMDNFTEDDVDMDSEIDMDSGMIEDEDDFSDELEDELEEEMEEEMEEEEGEYLGTRLMNELAEKLGTEVVDNKIIYNDTEINFFSEDEKFHIGKNKFETVDEVLEFLTGSAGSTQEMDDDMMGDDEMPMEETPNRVKPEPMEEEPFESKRFKYMKKFKI